MKEEAIAAALEAGKIIKNGFDNIKTIKYKRGNSADLVTNIDLEAEKKIISIIKKSFPDHTIISEEAGIIKKRSPYTWIIDPLDGTTCFTKNIPCFSTSIALYKNNLPFIGCVYLPITDELFFAEKGKGAYRNNKKITVSKIDNLAKAFSCVEWWSRDLKFKNEGIQVFNKIAKKSKKIRYISSTVWDLMRIANGDFDLHICDTAFLDIAASLIIIEEAGGKITDDRSKPIKYFSKDITKIVSANHKLHQKAINQIKKG